MLKLTYTDMSLHLDRLADSLEEVVAQRVILALRTGQPFHVEPSCAAFLLPVALPGLASLEAAIEQEQLDGVAVLPADVESVEVNLRGTWLASTSQAHEGIFLTVLGDRTEFLVHRLWEVTQAKASFLL
jgi:hypothetical protein